MDKTLQNTSYDEAYVQVETLLSTLEAIQNKTDELAEVKVNPLFPDFPEGALYDCSSIVAAIRMELQHQLKNDSCVYDTVDFQIPTGELRWERGSGSMPSTDRLLLWSAGS